MGKFYATKDPTITDREREHLTLSRKIAGESVVLLENDGTLPLDAPGPVALFGNGARHTVRGGTGSGDVNTREDVNVEHGLENAGFSVKTKPWLDRQDALHMMAEREYGEWIQAYAREHGVSEFFAGFSHGFKIPAPCSIEAGDLAENGADTAIFVISRTSGEGSDRDAGRGDYLLYEEERDAITAIAKAYPHTVVVLNVGGVVDLSELRSIPGVSAILLIGQAGSAGGDALADILLGKVNPCGRLTDTWAKKYADYPSAMTYSHMNGNLDDEYYSEGILVGYRWFDAMGIEPLYPFGYGLSYTEFSWDKAEAEIREGKCILRISIRNTGNRSGREVVQAYAGKPAGNLGKEKNALVAFAKTKLLNPGEAERIELCFAVRDLASYSEGHAAWILEAGEYRIFLGRDSRRLTDVVALSLDQALVTRQLRRFFHDMDPVYEIPIPERPVETANSAILRIQLDPGSIQTETVIYSGERTPCHTDKIRRLTIGDIREGRCTTAELVAQLSISEMAELCVGTLRADGFIVGNASHAVPGAAGDTSSALENSRGIRGLIMADGPAGLRLEPVFRADAEGNLLPADTEEEAEAETYYQYCTAIPVGWNLAMSWDPALVRETAAMIGREMKLFGVDLWLAPALNIHRNPLCGRNFEYNSEDPLIAGTIASAICEGVQSIPGKGVTVKHFAANNQEDNRYFTNAHVSERALREIYLRGFEIAVRSGKPAAIMTSYNLINGTHTSNHRDLLQGVLRDEWGYEGLVMTDWFTSQSVPEMTGGIDTKYPISSSAGCIAAGNDLQMPGCEKNVEDILTAVRSGEAVDGYRITRADLEACALRVIRTVLMIQEQKPQK